MLFGLIDKNKSLLKKYSKIANKINELEESMKSLSDTELPGKTLEFKNRLKQGESLDDILPEAFAVVREASQRTIGMRHFDVQLMGGIALHEGKITEMKTGEGKTLVATLPIYLNALTEENVHLATHNDYLAKRDANWMGPVYEYLGLSVGYIQANMDKEDRKKAYQADITYGTANEFGFDYLRDNLVYEKNDKVQRGHYFTIVDEADSILIDEARTPLIISGPSDTPSELYRRFASLAKRFIVEKDYTIDEKQKTLALTEEGINKAEKLLSVDNLYDPSNIKYLFHLLNALKAINFFKRDKDYIVRDGEVVIVDEFTGRLLPGRRYSEGLHQAIEAKEGVKIKEESVTFATITFQNYFRMYEKLSGMTGTAKTEEDEFKAIYNTEVVVIPTNEPVIREDRNDLIFKTEKEKYQAIIDEIVKRNQKGQPVLVGTTSIENSETISEMLKKRGIKHEVLNAKYHEREAEIIAQAGEKNAVTIATNMAGRGTDIKLGEGVKELGGLFILGTERHESRRIDNQLIGRSGRQGDPGESRFIISFEDDVLRLFGGERMKNMMNALKIEEGQPIEHKMLSRVIRDAQKKIEGIHFSIRKRLYEFDSVMDKQRSVIYNHRDWILEQSNYDDHIKEIFMDVVERIVESSWDEVEEKYDKSSISEKLKQYLIISDIKGNTREEIENEIFDLLWKRYQYKKEEFGEDFSKVAKFVMLRIIDEKWRYHLDAIEALKEAVSLRSYGQKDPVMEFKKESYLLFDQMVDSIYDEIVNYLMRIAKLVPEKEEKEAKKIYASLNFVHNNVSAVDESNDGGRSKSKNAIKQSNKIKKRYKVKR
ncbi:preprotein translocase subunit SecA [Petrotoga sp. 9T1HF07.CasAA.8.2]|uniref:preprotein translocase subunit SecA n=1 Tax=Petrotoga sp. 9T1HF07.CasAA.8.2 TaxID=1434329 RepID=UPI000CC8F7CB|nr:preprotein translocase subunit SecA [Petrotoga sp. 9T1HF07.CasAA.8.2]PNR88201.1 preprotein translocase subunit SecA [Petrotoga sp. 9T1HF07.CasAA.8.2]